MSAEPNGDETTHSGTEPVRRRRRVRPPENTGPDAGTTGSASLGAGAGSGDGTGSGGDFRPVPAPVGAADNDSLPAERGLRGLVGGGSSQVSPAAAMRARDAARPRPEDIMRAETELTIVRRHWSPRD